MHGDRDLFTNYKYFYASQLGRRWFLHHLNSLLETWIAEKGEEQAVTVLDLQFLVEAFCPNFPFSVLPVTRGLLAEKRSNTHVRRLRGQSREQGEGNKYDQDQDEGEEEQEEVVSYALSSLLASFAIEFYFSGLK